MRIYNNLISLKCFNIGADRAVCIVDPEKISCFIIRQFISPTSAAPAPAPRIFLWILNFVILDLGKKRRRPSSQAPLISIYDTLIITFDPLSLAAVIRFNFHSQVAKCEKLAVLDMYYDNA